MTEKWEFQGFLHFYTSHSKVLLLNLPWKSCQYVCPLSKTRSFLCFLPCRSHRTISVRLRIWCRYSVREQITLNLSNTDFFKHFFTEICSHWSPTIPASQNLSQHWLCSWLPTVKAGREDTTCLADSAPRAGSQLARGALTERFSLQSSGCRGLQIKTHHLHLWK